MEARGDEELDFLRPIKWVVAMALASLVLVLGVSGYYCFRSFYREAPEGMSEAVLEKKGGMPVDAGDQTGLWAAPDSTLIPAGPRGDLIRYGRQLLSHTAKYLGPKGEVRAVSNGMNCQNCHLRGGTVPYGNNYAAVWSTYPKFRSRSGTIESIEQRVNDCIERSLNGEPLDRNSLEMQALLAYFKWLGKDVRPGEAPRGAGITTVPLLNRAADSLKGKAVYNRHCQRCHGQNGTGFKYPDSVEWKYPPLAGADSYNAGAGLYRLSRFAGFVKSNMPYGTTYDKPVLSDEEAWDVAAYVNSLPRPQKAFPRDWPDIKEKPFDYPFGPYADSFPETQHKYGPFLTMQRQRPRVSVR